MAGTATFEATRPALDIARLQTFSEKVMHDFAAAMVALACAVGDRLGLFRALADSGNVSLSTLAELTRMDDRLLREWLRTLTAAGYLYYDAADQTYSLPAELAELLATEDGAMRLAGGFQLLLGLAGPIEQITKAFRSGRGVTQSAYPDHLWQGMERMSAAWFDNFMVQQWLPAAGLLPRLRSGIRVADLGCGSGRALLRLATEFPASSFVGYDAFPGTLARARNNARLAGLENRVFFRELDITGGIPERFDLIMTLNSLHDVVDLPLGIQAIRRALLPGGSWLILEGNCSDKLEDNLGTLGTILYGTSLFYNTPVSLAGGGPGEGALALPESKMRRLCEAARFELRRLSVPNPMHALYQAFPL
jgi:SAM-dependent methyltransferase